MIVLGLILLIIGLVVSIPILTTIGGLVAFLVLLPKIPASSGTLGSLLVVAFAAIVVRLIWRWIDWTRSLFFFTPYRIIYVHGIITRKIAMLPMGKVTDMRYDRTPAGQLLDYGMFIICLLYTSRCV